MVHSIRRVAIRVDASVQIGTGHVMRCLTLAHQLHQEQIDVSFITRLLPGHLCDLIESQGFSVYRLPSIGTSEETDYFGWLEENWEEDARQTIESLGEKQGNVWVIIDHYGLERSWEREVRKIANRIMVIDDLANRYHDCDILLDQNLFEDFETRYDNLVPQNCKMLLGPRFALLRPEFLAARNVLRERDGNIQTLLIFFGGSDPTNETAKALEAIAMLDEPEIAVTIIVGSSNPKKEVIQAISKRNPNFSFHCQVDNMAELIARADLAIGAGGTALWERCFLGLPTILVVVAENQTAAAAAVAKRGAAWNLGWHEEVRADQIADAISYLMCHPEDMKKMSRSALDIVAGSGEKQNVIVQSMMEVEG